MTDKINTETQAVDAETEPGLTTVAAADKTAENQVAPAKRGLLLPVAVLLLAGTAAAGGYWLWQQQQHLALQQQQQQQQQQYQTTLSQLQQSLTQAELRLSTGEKESQELLQVIQQRLNSHNKRLLSISTTSRDDWLLAEAEYLLRLANQRLIMERGTLGAQALVQAADDILRQLDDVELFAVRKALAQDLSELKLAGQVDREGLYLRLAAVAEQVQSLALAAPELIQPAEQETAEAALPSPEGFWPRLQQGFERTLAKFGDYVRIRQHEAPVLPLLSPQEQVYVSQNLRLMIERAQLAMLREEPTIYRQSLEQAEQWLATHYSLSDKARALGQELAALQNMPVQQTLPSIAGSLTQLKAYIDRLHKLTPKTAAASPKPLPQPSEGSKK